jgi:carbonic anhydrase
MRIVLSFAISLLSLNSAYADSSAHWSYQGEGGPANWAALSAEFSACEGKNQSPINLTGFIEAELKAIRFNYHPGGTEILNNGHTVQVNFEPGSSIELDQVEYALKQFHFHAPSENQLDGKSYPMEGHLVHADKNGNLAVISVMFTEGKDNKVITEAWAKLPQHSGEKNLLPSPLSAEGILPSNRDYYRFNGSLTTPPCTEGVRWLVMKDAVAVSKQQIGAFSQALEHPNNRPLQALNARVVLK